MKVLLGISIPEDLSALSPEELASLTADLKAAIVAALSAETTPAIADEAEAADALITEAEALATERTEAEAALSARRTALLDKFSESDADEVEASGADASDESDDADETDEADAGDDVEAATDEAAVTASTWKPTLSAVEAGAPKSKAPKVAPQRRTLTFADANWKATSSIDGVNAGATFESPRQLAEALSSRWDTIKGGGSEKIAVARTMANFRPEQVLSDDTADNIAKFGGLDPFSGTFTEALTAAFCAPSEPLYDIPTSSSTARPVKAALATYQPKRGSVSVFPSPKLSDVEDQDAGYGIWRSADDSDQNAVKTCATIPCSSPVVYELYGVWRCLTIKNLMALTFPELVDAILNRLGSLHARLGEVTLLDAMLASVNVKAMTVDANLYGSSINLLGTILNAVEVYRSEERYDDQMFDAFIPRHVMTSLRMDLANQNREGGSLRARLAPASDVNAALRDAGLDVTWTMDTATTWASVPAAVDGQALPALPTDYDIIMTPRGNFRALDRGDLTVGVQNGGIYRDNASNSKNQATLFQENFEGLIDFGATTYALTIQGACPSGAQVADVTAITCPESSGS